MKLLAIETATTGCSVVLWIDGERRERYEPVARRQTETVLPMVDELLGAAGMALRQLDALAFSRGPGAFTGVRVGTSVAQGLALAAELPVAPVSTLAACAWMGIERLETEAPVLAAFDARMGEIYLGGYRRAESGLETLHEDCLCAPERLPDLSGHRWYGVGSGGIHAEHLAAQLSLEGEWLTDVEPHARAVAELGVALLAAGGGVSAEQALPVYLRNRVTQG